MPNGDDYDRGRHDARLEARIGVLEEEHTDVVGRITSLSTAVDGLKDAVNRMAGAEDRRSAVDEATRQLLETHTKRQVTSRQFWMGIGMLIITLGAFVLTLVLALNSTGHA